MRGVGDGRLDRSRRTFGGGMDRVRRLSAPVALLVFLLSLLGVASSVCASQPPGTSPGTYPSQGAASAACQGYAVWNGGGMTCVFDAGSAPYVDTRSPPVCIFPALIGGGSYNGIYNGSNYGSFTWCVPATCTGASSGSNHSQQWGGVYQDGTVYCDNGCMSLFHMASGVGSLEFSDGSGGSWGWFESNGNRCSSPIDADLLKHQGAQNPVCDPGKVSCFSPDRGFCGTTESGELVCEPAPPPGQGGCAAGATGATCVGNGTPPPVPPDPPIGKDSPPTSSGTSTGKDAGGDTYNYTQNNYSGTSPGPGSSSPPSSSGGGSQSNTAGSGNSPGPNGSAGTGSDGKCGDGSVPTASGCSGTFTDVGCDTPPACFGDAVMCGNAKENWATRCAVQKMAAASASSGGASYGDPSSALAAAGVPADGGASGDPSTSGLVTSSDLGQDGFDASGLGFSRTCPASPQFSVLGHSYTLDLTPLCNFASLLGWFVLLCAFLVSLRIVSASRA